MAELLLIMTIRIDEKRQGTIEVRDGDDPEVLARDFCIKYNVNQKLVHLLIDNINQNLEVAEQQKTKVHPSNNQSGQDTMQYSTETCNSQFIDTPFNEPLHQYNSNTSVHDRLYEDAKNKRLKQKLVVTDSRSKKIKPEPEINYGLFLYQKGLKKREERLLRAESARKDLQNSQLVECTHHPKINFVSQQRDKRSVSEHLNGLAKERKLKRENASQRRIETEQQKCSFKPKINRISRFIVEEKNERKNQPWFQSLYSDYDSKRQKMEQLDKQYFSYSFHPKIDMISEKITQGSSFEERQRMRSASRQNLSVCEDENQLFKPKTGRPPERRPKDLFSNLYNQAQVWEQNRQTQIARKIQEQQSAAQIKASQRSNAIIQTQIQNALINLFDLMDTDSDGYINADHIDCSSLNGNQIRILQPLLLEMESGNHTLNKQEFVESAERLVATLAIDEKHQLLRKPNTKVEKPQFSFHVLLSIRTHSEQWHLKGIEDLINILKKIQLMSDDGDYKDDDFGDNPDGGDDGGQGDLGDGGDGGDAGDGGDGGDGGDPGDGDGGLGDGDEGIDDDGLEPGDEDLDKEADEEPKQISDNLPLTIEEQGLDENQKLRKWKDLLGKHIQNVQQYRAKNNNLRGQLKKLGDKAEKLVQSNVRKQKLLDQKLESKHTYLAENKILIEITKNKKPISDFTDKIPKAILERMVEIYNKEQSNASMREQIKSLKDRNKNLDQNESVNQLTNDLVLIEKQIQDEEKLKKKFDLILIEQQAALKQQQMDCDYEGRLKNLQKETKEIKDKIKEYQKKELNSTRREIELNNHYARLQKIYRKMCEILNKPCEDQKFLYRQKDEPHEESKASKSKEFSKKINEGNQKARFEMKANAVEKESEDELNKALKEFRDNKEEKFKELQENVKKLTEELDTKEKESQKQKKQLQEDQMKLQEEIGQLIKQMKEKEFEAKSTVTQLNDLNRQKQLTDKKPVSEPTLSTLNKPETIMFGNDQKTETCLPFNDYKNLDWGQNLPIHKIEICKNKKDLIVGLELYYGADEKSPETKITKHIGQLDSDIDKVTVEIDKDDKINYVSGFYNADQIIFLKFETTKKKITSIGNMKYKDATTKDFRIDIKDREIIGFCGVLDYTSESQNPSERFLVAFGLNLKGKEMDIKTKKRLKKQQDLEEQEKKRIPVDYRKITYPFKRNPPKHLDLIKSQPKLDVSVQDQERMQYYYKQKERIIQAQRTQLGLASAKLFSPTTFRTSEYLKEEQMRREKSEKRREWLEKKREENKSSQLLPLIEHKTPAEKDKKDKKADKNASPQKQQQKAPAKKDDPKAKKK